MNKSSSKSGKIKIIFFGHTKFSTWYLYCVRCVFTWRLFSDRFWPLFVLLSVRCRCCCWCCCCWCWRFVLVDNMDLRVFIHNTMLNGSIHILFRKTHQIVKLSGRNKTKLMSSNYSRSNHYRRTKHKHRL